VYADKNGCIIEYDAERDTHVVNMEAISEKLGKISEEIEQLLIIDGHYSHEILVEQQVSLVVILRKAPWKLYETLQKRFYRYQKVWENTEAEILGVITKEVQKQFPMEKLHEIDTTNKTPEESAKEIIKVLSGKKQRSLEPIDWIKHPETLNILVKRPVSNN
jgi:adenylate kinase